MPETSYYGALEALLNGVGRTLNPSVVTVLTLRNIGAGLPDGGLFAGHQLSEPSDPNDPWERQIPERGVLEVKGAEKELADIIASEQVQRYLARYGRVLVTNLRAFQVVRLDKAGVQQIDEPFTLAATVTAFWHLCSQPQASQAVVADEVAIYLRQVLAEPAPITRPDHLAWMLASYARATLAHIDKHGLASLAPLRQALEQALGISFVGERAEPFFKSSLVQTLIYGLFAAWILRTADNPNAAPLDWRLAGWELDVPLVQSLFNQVAQPGPVEKLGVGQYLSRAGECLNRVDWNRFYSVFDLEHAIEYFYEPFLAAFDPDLRKELGVWYTPPEVVQYMVHRVDTALKEDFDLPLGLADPSVIVLDPCVGTGSYLLEVLRIIRERLIGPDPGSADALINFEIKQAAQNRIFGFEILPAPFVISHLQIGLLLKRLGVPFTPGTWERAAVYLTNSLTGWTAAPSAQIDLFPELEQERDAAEHVKQQDRVLVVLGNPPYNAFAGVATDQEAEMVSVYKEGVRGRNTLDDLYVRFYRIAEHRIAEMTGQGIVCLITNSSFIARPSFKVMRRRLLSSFDTISVDNLNGDRDETGKRTPRGKPDPSIFSTPRNQAGIAEGTAITLLVRKPDRQDGSTASVEYRSFWGRTKRADLLEVAAGQPPQDPETDQAYEDVTPSANNLWAFRPVKTIADYYDWLSIDELVSDAPIYGLHEARGGGLIDSDRGALEARMRAYLNPAIGDSDLPDTCAPLLRNWYGFDPGATRRRLTGKEAGNPGLARPFAANKLRAYDTRPFDSRYAYVETEANLWVAPQPALIRHSDAGSAFLYVRRTVEAADDGFPVWFSSNVGDQHALHKTCYLIPTGLAAEVNVQATFDDLSSDETLALRANLSELARDYVTRLGFGDPDQDGAVRDLIWMHALAILMSPDYQTENAAPMRQGYPRLPLPAESDMLTSSATLGRRLAAMINIESTALERLPELGAIAVLRTVDGTAANPSAGDLKLTASWGRRVGQAVMPGSGSTRVRSYQSTEMDGLQRLADKLETDLASVIQLLGDSTVDVVLNDRTIWANVPWHVWNVRIGGFPVLKKWLSYRDYNITGQSLTFDEARRVTRMAQRLSGLLLLTPLLNQNYREVVTHQWSRSSSVNE